MQALRGFWFSCGLHVFLYDGLSCMDDICVKRKEGGMAERVAKREGLRTERADGWEGRMGRV